MTASRTYRPRAFLAAAVLLGGVTLAACSGHPTSAPTVGSAAAVTTPAAASAPPQTTVPAAAASPTTSASAASSATSNGAAQTAGIEQDLAGVSNQLAAAGHDLQDGPTEQTIDPRG